MFFVVVIIIVIVVVDDDDVIVHVIIIVFFVIIIIIIVIIVVVIIISAAPWSGSETVGSTLEPASGRCGPLPIYNHVQITNPHRGELEGKRNKSIFCTSWTIGR